MLVCLFFQFLCLWCLRLNQLELSPEETPYIGFCADQLQMRENLLSYGRVDVNGVPTTSNAFEEPCKPSASLPRHVEEYEDADHHVFYKTLQDIQRTPDTSTSVSFCFVLIYALSHFRPKCGILPQRGLGGLPAEAFLKS